MEVLGMMIKKVKMIKKEVTPMGFEPTTPRLRV